MHRCRGPRGEAPKGGFLDELSLSAHKVSLSVFTCFLFAEKNIKADMQLGSGGMAPSPGMRPKLLGKPFFLTLAMSTLCTSESLETKTVVSIWKEDSARH